MQDNSENELTRQLEDAALSRHGWLSIEYDELECVWEGLLQAGGEPLRAFGLTRREVCEQLLQTLNKQGLLKRPA